MDTAAKKKYLSKIQKLMRLADNTSSPAEAASAMSKAQKFMKEHGLSESEVVFAEVSVTDSKTSPSDAEKLPRYMCILVDTIKKAFGVTCLAAWRLTPGMNRRRVIKFCGLEGRDAAAAYVFDVLARQIKSARKNFLLTHCAGLHPAVKVVDADRFCEGWASGAYHAVKKLEIPSEQESKMAAHMDSLKKGGVGKAKVRGAGREDKPSQAARLGYREGREAKVFHGVDGSTSPALIGSGV